MPTRKIADLPKPEGCLNRDHNPPSMMVFTPGVYEHECPECGKKTRFVVRGTRYTSTPESSVWTGKFNEHMNNAMKQLDDAMKTLEKAFEGR